MLFDVPDLDINNMTVKGQVQQRMIVVATWHELRGNHSQNAICKFLSVHPPSTSSAMEREGMGSLMVFFFIVTFLL